MAAGSLMMPAAAGPVSATPGLVYATRGVAAKLGAPPPPRFQVMRRSICEQLAQADPRCVLVRAPAGFGKTTLLLQLRAQYESLGSRSAWLTLDKGDNDLARLLSLLSAVLDELEPRALPAEGTTIGDLALDVLDRIAALRQPFVLFLDDFEMLYNPAALALLSRAIESLPPQGRIVIGSRNLPEIGLGRLRARGHLGEVDVEALRFSLDEVGEFLLRQCRLPLDGGQVQRLHAAAEGWIAALWLAAAALMRRGDHDTFIRGFSGSNAELADYLSEDVLARLPVELREFLLASSVLEELSAPLCNRVCARSDSEILLRRLERDHLFLIPQDAAHSHYRYHRLFAEFLRNQLVREWPEARVAELQCQASDAYRDQGRPIPAIQHAVLSGDPAHALPLLIEHAPALLAQGRLRLLAHWLETLPESLLQQAPQLRIVLAWALCVTRGHRHALDAMDSLEADALDPAAAALLRSMRPALLAVTDRIEEAHAMALAALPLIPLEQAFGHGLIAETLSLTCLVQGLHAQARTHFDEARRTESLGRGQFHAVAADTAEAMLDLMQGRLRQARARLQTTLDGAGGGLVADRGRRTIPSVLLAEVLYENDDCEAAQRLLEVYVPLSRSLGLPDQLISGHVLLSRIVADHGDRDRALRLLGELEAIGQRLDLPRVIASARLEQSRQALAQGDGAGALEWLRAAAGVADWSKLSSQWLVANDTTTLSLAELRWQIRCGSPQLALPQLRHELETAEEQQRQRRALKLRILYAEALQRSGQHRQALRCLGQALRFAAGEGFVRSFREEGETIASLLREYELSREAEGEAEVAVRSLIRAAGPRTAALTRMDAPMESLTRKELQVLELLAQGHSNNDMAEKLFVSETTVRTHLRSINTKLHAGNRTQAIAVARRYQLIA